MSTSTTITCGTDFSDGARRAVAVACALAARVGARLQLVHVVNDLGAELAFAENLAQVYEPRREKLESYAAELRYAFDIAVDPVFGPGVPHRYIVDVARQAKSDLIVVSALGQTPQHTRWLLGSVAERVAQAAPLPVLVIRDGSGLTEWASGTRPLRLLVGVDDGAPARAALDWVGKLRRWAPCDVRIMRIVFPAEAHARLGVPPPVPLEGLQPSVEGILRRELLQSTGELPGEGAVSWLVEGAWGTIDLPLLHEARRMGADLVVIGTNQRAGVARVWQGSVSRQVLHSADGDVATVPASSPHVMGISRYERVLVATDFSDVANRAIGPAYGLVPREGVVYLVHVTEASVATSEPSVRERLASLVPPAAVARGIVTVIEVVASEDVANALLQLGARRGVDAICMATHGRTGIRQVVLGSVAQEVVRQARCPVVLVPPNAAALTVTDDGA